MSLYSSPMAYLNRFFKGQKKFKFILSGDADLYENEDWQLTWIEHEKFALSERIIDRDVGADWYEDIYSGDLIECVQLMRKAGKQV